MKTTRNALFALLLLGVPLAASAQLSVGAGANIGARGHASVDVGFFYDQLASYGNWIERPNYGWVWTPRDVSASWRPYQAGHWVWSDEGWTWLSDEPYGWATYHYGRWYQDSEIGWAWVPGTDWGPAWVSWQEGQDNVGWAPLPPGANVVNASYNNGPSGPQGPGYDDGSAYDGGGYDNGPVYDQGPGYDNGPAYDGGYDDNYRYDSSSSYGNGYYGGDGYYDGGYGGYAYGIAPSAYLFVPVRSFLAVDLFDFYLPWVRVSSFWGYTRNCTYYGYRGGHYFNRGVPFEHVQRYYHNVPRYQLSELGGFRGRGFQVQGNRVAFYRPQVQRGRGITPLQRPAARGSVMRAEQFRSAFPDRVARAQRDFNANRQGFRGQVQGANPGRQGFQQGQRFQQGRPFQQGQTNNGYRGQADRQRQYDTLQRNRQQVYGQRQFDNQRGQAQVDRQRQNDAQRRNQGQVYRQRQNDNQQQQRWQQNQPNRQYSAPRVQERSYQQQRSYGTQRQASPQREYRAPSRGQDNNRGQSRGQGNNNNGHRRGHGG